MTYISL